jgi:hypothetical protein
MGEGALALGLQDAQVGVGARALEQVKEFELPTAEDIDNCGRCRLKSVFQSKNYSASRKLNGKLCVANRGVHAVCQR